jgi:hypothetical protein
MAQLAQKFVPNGALLKVIPKQEFFAKLMIISSQRVA